MATNACHIADNIVMCIFRKWQIGDKKQLETVDWWSTSLPQTPTHNPTTKKINNLCEFDLWPIDLEIVQDTSSVVFGPHMNIIHEIGKVTAKLPWKINRSQRTLNVTHPLLLKVICAKYGKNPSRTVCAVEQTWQDVMYFGSFIEKSGLNGLEDRSRSKVIMCNTSLHASNHFCMIWRESVQNCTVCMEAETCITYILVNLIRDWLLIPRECFPTGLHWWHSLAASDSLHLG